MYVVELWFRLITTDKQAVPDKLATFKRRVELPFPPFLDLHIYFNDEEPEGSRLFSIVWVPEENLFRCRVTEDEAVNDEGPMDEAIRWYRNQGWNWDGLDKFIAGRKK